MLISQAFPSKYLRAADLQGHRISVVISRVDMEGVNPDDPNERKPVVYFQGKQKGLVLNVTNANRISDLYGDETDLWVNKPLELFAVETEYRGKPVQGLRVSGPSQQAAQAQAPVQQPAPPAEGLDDEIPF